MRRPLGPVRASVLVLGLAFAPAAFASPPQDPAPDGDAPGKVVLVEAFVSQGCDLCPRAEGVLRALDEEFGPRIAVVAFHVDYFDDPWKDPFSDPRFSKRELQYSTIYDREHRLNNPGYLYLTPLIMVDGRVPMVGSNDDTPAKARAAIRGALAKPPTLDLALTLADAPDGPARKALTVALAPRKGAPTGRPLLVEVVTIEDGLTTDVRSGELAGRAYSGHNVARAFDQRRVRLAPGRAESLTFDLALRPDWDPARCRVVALVQGEDGRVHQAAAVPWVAPGPDARD
jgi:hypothetical protein